MVPSFRVSNISIEKNNASKEMEKLKSVLLYYTVVKILIYEIIDYRMPTCCAKVFRVTSLLKLMNVLFCIIGAMGLIKKNYYIAVRFIYSLWIYIPIHTILLIECYSIDKIVCLFVLTKTASLILFSMFFYFKITKFRASFTQVKFESFSVSLKEKKRIENMCILDSMVNSLKFNILLRIFYCNISKNSFSEVAVIVLDVIRVLLFVGSSNEGSVKWKKLHTFLATVGIVLYVVVLVEVLEDFKFIKLIDFLFFLRNLAINVFFFKFIFS